MTSKKIEACIDCEFHETINDPDPHDWFCDDDVAVVCTLVENDKRNLESEYMSDGHKNKLVTRSCRPYRIRKETIIPSWCPKGLNLKRE
jgi:hypothetical protein